MISLKGRKKSDMKARRNNQAISSLVQVFAEGKYAEFIAAISGVDPKLARNPRLLLAQGHAYYELDKFQNAVACYTQVIRLKLSRKIKREAIYNRALAHRELQQDERALKDFFSAGVEYAKSRCFIGELLYFTSQRKKFRLVEASRHLSVWLRKRPDDHYSRYWLGACYNQLNKPHLALKHMIKCLDAGYFTNNTIEGTVTELWGSMTTLEIEDLVVKKAQKSGVCIDDVRSMLAHALEV